MLLKQLIIVGGFDTTAIDNDAFHELNNIVNN